MPTIVRVDCFGVDPGAGQPLKHWVKVRLRERCARHGIVITHSVAS